MFYKPFCDLSAADSYYDLVRYAGSLVSFLVILRSVTFMRASEGLGSLVRMVQQVFLDLRAFFIVMSVVMLVRVPRGSNAIIIVHHLHPHAPIKS